MSKVVKLTLRNRTLNRFKLNKKQKLDVLRQQIKSILKKQIKKSAKRLKTLRLITHPQLINPKSVTFSPKMSTLSIAKLSSKPGSPQSKSPIAKKIGMRTIKALIGHRRLFLRNRRIMTNSLNSMHFNGHSSHLISACA